MKSAFAGAAIFFLSPFAHAESIYCYFTEPFLKAQYNSDTNKILLSSPEHGSAELDAKIEFQKQGVIRISAVGFNYYLDVNTLKEGSDGMSDIIYPFEGVVVSEKLYGGCETDTLKGQDPNAPANNTKK